MTNITERLNEMEKEIQALKQWKANCNVFMAWWGGVCMAALTLGSAVVNYYQDIKAHLMTLWAIK